MSHYCDVAPGHPYHGPYHDKVYGLPVDDDQVLFERLILELNQAGLSWLTILKKWDNFVAAYDKFDISRVAAYGDRDRERLLADEGIIRNRRKIDAAIFNAGEVLEIQNEYGSFKAWLDHHHPLTRQAWVKLFKERFRFTGGEITGEFLMSTGYLPGAHRDDCPVFAQIKQQRPPWLRATAADPVS